MAKGSNEFSNVFLFFNYGHHRPTLLTEQVFCSEVQRILDDWVLNVESVYARSEAHAISDSREDISRLGMFNNNAEKTIFKFIKEAAMAIY